MTKKFFSFIHGGSVRAAPKTKVIPSAEFSTLQSAQEVLEKAKEDAENYKKEIVAEIEKLKELAEKEGYEAGFKKWAEHVARLEEEIGKVRKEVESVVLPVALKAAKKIVSKEIELSKETIVDIVAGTLKAVSQHKNVTIYVNRKDLDTVEAQRPRIKELFERLESLTILDRPDIESGGCVVETEVGIINAQMENRWRILESAFEKSMTRKPNA